MQYGIGASSPKNNDKGRSLVHEAGTHLRWRGAEILKRHFAIVRRAVVRLRACLKAPFVNHRQPRTAFESDTGHSTLSAGTRFHAPYLPLAIPTRIGSIGWKADLDCAEIRVRLVRLNLPLCPHL
jgi:hypothetical protein